MYEQMYAETKQEEEADRAKKREKERRAEKERGGEEGRLGGKKARERNAHDRERETSHKSRRARRTTCTTTFSTGISRIFSTSIYHQSNGQKRKRIPRVCSSSKHMILLSFAHFNFLVLRDLLQKMRDANKNGHLLVNVHDLVHRHLLLDLDEHFFRNNALHRHLLRHKACVCVLVCVCVSARGWVWEGER